MVSDDFREDPDSQISTLHVNDVETLIERGIASGGMIPKLRACERSVKGGVHKTHIIDGSVPHALFAGDFYPRGYWNANCSVEAGFKPARTSAGDHRGSPLQNRIDNIIVGDGPCAVPRFLTIRI